MNEGWEEMKCGDKAYCPVCKKEVEVEKEGSSHQEQDNVWWRHTCPVCDYLFDED